MTTATTTNSPNTPSTQERQESLTEATNATIARRVAKEYASRLCYVRSTDKAQAIDRAAGWLAYREGVWMRQGAEKAALEAIDSTIRAMLQEASKDPDSSRMRERTRDLLNALNRMPAIKQVATYYLDKPLSAFNTNPYLLNVKNGTLNLRALDKDTQKDQHVALFRDADGGDFCSKQATANYDPMATAPRWLTFLDEVFEGDAEVIGFVQRALGYTLLGINPEHAAFICHGRGGNGKGVTLETVAGVLGSYAGDLNPDVLVSDYVRSGSSLQPELTAHRDTRLIVSSEPKRGVLNGHRMKSWTGDSHVQLRMMYGEAEQMTVTFTFWMTTNVLPDLNEQTDAVERRMHLVPFRVSFKGRENLDLKAQLAEERDGILNWLLAGLADWYDRRANNAKSASGDSGLCPPESIVQASQDWLTSESLFTRLFDEVLVRGESSKDRLLLADLTDALTHYVDDHQDDFPRTTVNAKLVNNFLKTFGLVKRTTGGEVWVYGIKLDVETPESDYARLNRIDAPLSNRELLYITISEYDRPMRVGEVAEATGMSQRSLYVTLGRMADEGLLRKYAHTYSTSLRALDLDAAWPSEDWTRFEFIYTLMWKLLWQEAHERGGGVMAIDTDALSTRLGLDTYEVERLLHEDVVQSNPGLAETATFDVRNGHKYSFTFDPAAFER